MEKRRALILGVANDRSLAWAIAKQLFEAGAELGFSYQGEALERRVRPLAEEAGSRFVEPCDVSRDEDLDAIFAKVKERWGRLDYLIHSVAFANKEDLEGRFVDTSRAGFAKALDISAYSLVAATRRAEPLMNDGGSIVTL